MHKCLFHCSIMAAYADWIPPTGSTAHQEYLAAGGNLCQVLEAGQRAPTATHGCAQHVAFACCNLLLLNDYRDACKLVGWLAGQGVGTCDSDAVSWLASIHVCVKGVHQQAAGRLSLWDVSGVPLASSQSERQGTQYFRYLQAALPPQH